MLSVNPPLSLIAGHDGLMLDSDLSDVQLVRASGFPAGGSGPGGCLYPAFRQLLDPLRCPLAASDLEAVWAAAAAGASLTPGQYYLGLYAGVADGRRLFVVAPPALPAFVTNVCPQFAPSGGCVTHLVVQYQGPDGTVFCVTDPTGCCGGSGGGTGTCCGVDSDTLFASFTTLGGCACVGSATWPLAPQGGGVWLNRFTGFGGPNPCWTFQASCSAGVWAFQVGGPGSTIDPPVSFTFVSAACSPFAVSFSFTDTLNIFGCGPGAVVHVTMTT